MSIGDWVACWFYSSSLNIEVSKLVKVFDKIFRTLETTVNQLIVKGKCSIRLFDNGFVIEVMIFTGGSSKFSLTGSQLQVQILSVKVVVELFS